MSELVPTLRFPKYKDNLKQASIENLTKLVTSGSRDWAQYYASSGSLFIRMTNLCRETSTIDLSNLKFVDVPHKSKDGFRTKLEYGDVLISITAELGKIGLVPINLKNAYINQHIALIKPYDAKDGRFLAHYLTAPKSHKRLNRLNDSGAKSGLNLSTIKRFIIQTPNQQEQQKIADFLTSVDSKISQLTEKHRLLSQYKKGVMQQIFSQQLRFKDDDGSEFGAWEEFSLSQLGSFLGGGTPSTENDFFWRGDIPWISSSDIQEDKLFTINISRYINTSAIRNSATKVIPANSLLIVSRVGIGKFAVCNQEICTSQDFTNFTPNTSNVNFMAYLLSHNKNRLLSLGQGTTIKGFTVSDLSSLKLEIPCLAEQQKIAQFLQAIDAKIDATRQQIEQTKLFKKGLLQQMFV